MFINKDSIVINNVSFGQYLVSAKYGYHKLWGPKTGRNLAGSTTGTLVGIFPKITLHFRRLTKEEIEYLAPILDSAYQTTQYYDAEKKAMTTMRTYSNDWEINNRNIIYGDVKNEGFEWAVISTKKRV